MLTIKNNFLQISVKKTGAELCSILSLNSGKEYMWNADPKFWGSHAPVLFPIIGSLKNGSFYYENKQYSVPKHGLIRNNNKLKVNATKTDRLEFSLMYDDESLKLYPFYFEFKVSYILSEKSVVVDHEVINHSLDTPMYFSLGGHPAFNCPINADESYSDYYLEFELDEDIDAWKIQKDGLLGPNKQPLTIDHRKWSITENMFDGGALIIKHLKSKKIMLKSKKSDQVLSIDFTDFSNLALWAIPNAPFICIEPWIGLPDTYDSDQQLLHKEGIIKLEPKKCYNASYTITIKD